MNELTLYEDGVEIEDDEDDEISEEEGFNKLFGDGNWELIEEGHARRIR